MKKDTMRKVAVCVLPLLVALIVVFVSIAACSSDDDTNMPPVASGSVVLTPSASIPNDDPSIRGFITRINYSAESTEILVEYYVAEGKEPAYAYDKAIVKLDENTAFVADDGSVVNLSSLSVGSVVEVWFSNPSAESFPVLAYGQAVRLITNGESITGVRILPQLSIAGPSNSLAGVLSANWKNKQYEFYTVNEVLDRTLGTHISASAGSMLSLNFSVAPDTLEATWSSSSYTTANALEVGENNQITVPQDAEGEIIIRVKADWANGTVYYVFSVSIIAAPQA